MSVPVTIGNAGPNAPCIDLPEQSSERSPQPEARKMQPRDYAAYYSTQKNSVGGKRYQIRPLADVERDHILMALWIAKGNKAVVCELLGIARKTLYNKLSLYQDTHIIPTPELCARLDALEILEF